MTKNTTITLTTPINKKLTPEFIFVIYDKDGCYIKECKTLVEVARYFKTSKQALSNYIRRTKQDKTNFKYKGFSIEYFNINEDL